MSEVVEALPDRLGTSNWMKRCHFEGLEHLDRARNEGRPVILVFFHGGPFRLLRPWLRAKGYPVAAVAGAKRDRPSIDRRIRDRHSPPPDVPIRFYVDQIWPLNRFLSGGGQLLIALDGFAGEQIRVEIQEGWTVRVATGPMRLAALHRADLIPCSIVDEGCWSFRVRLGAPALIGLLRPVADFSEAARYLVREILNQMSDHPDQFGPGFGSRFKKVENAENSR